MTGGASAAPPPHPDAGLEAGADRRPSGPPTPAGEPPPAVTAAAARP